MINIENKYKMINKLFLIFILLISFSCANDSHNIKNINISLENENFNIGEKLNITSCELNEIKDVNLIFFNSNNQIIKSYVKENINCKITISRLLDNIHNLNINDVFLKIEAQNDNVFLQSNTLKLNINPSITITSVCSSNLCEGISGNIVENISNKIIVKTVGEYFNKFTYEFYSKNELIKKYENQFNSITDFDYINNIVFSSVPQENSSYIVLLKVSAYNNEKDIKTETILPLRIVRPLEIKHYGKYELAETYEPIPVTGCIPGAIGSRIQYSESTSETRQNSVSIVLSKDFSQSLSNSIDISNSEEINIAETKDVINSSSLSNSESISETNTQNYNETNSNNFNFSTTDGENWSWTFNENNSSTNEQTNGTNTNINGEITTSVSGEGSLPFIAKASGSVSTTLGAGYDISNSNTISNTNSTEKGYITGQSSETQREYGSVNEISIGSELSGSYAIGKETSSTISQGTSQYSGRIWNMSESINSGKIITEGDSESIDNTIVSSSTSETTFSFEGFIPRGRVGKFFRQTSRYTKLSEIIVYDINGYPKNAGYISMNSWAWAPELAISDSCENLTYSDFLIPKCHIQPCGE